MSKGTRNPSRHGGKSKQQLIEELSRLEESLDAMPEALVAFDPEDRITYYNHAFEALFPSFAAVLRPGLPYRDMLRAQLAGISLKAAEGREDEWIEERVIRRKNLGPASEQLFDDGRVMQLNQYGTASGGTVDIRRDITELRRSQSVERQQQSQLQTLMYAVPMPMFFKDSDGRYLGCNPAYERFMGVREADLVGKRIGELIGQERAVVHDRADMALFASKGSDVYERTAIAGSGAQREVIFYKTVFGGNDEVPQTLVGVLIDITEIRVAERTLRQSEERWAAIFQKSPNGMVLYNLSSKRILEVNNTWCSDWGFERDQIVGKKTSELNVFHNAPAQEQLYRLLKDQGFVDKFEADYVVRNGETRIAQISARIIVLDGIDCILSIVVDITTTKRAEQALAKSEAQFRDLIEGSIQGTIIHVDYQLVFANGSAAAMFGYDDVDDLLRQGSYAKLIAETDRHRLQKYKEERLKGGSAPDTYEFQGLRKDGVSIWVENRVTLIDWQGQRAVQTNIVDISERMQARHALAESERQFRNLIEGSAQGITVVVGNRIVFANNMAVEIFGYDSPGVLMRDAINVDLVARQDRDRIIGYAAQRQSDGQPPRLYDFLGLRRDGTTVWLENRTTLISWRGESAILIFTIDISDRKLAQQALAESERQFRNLIEGSLQGIVVYVDRRVAFANQAAAEIFGYHGEGDAMTGIFYLDLVAPEERDRYRRISELRHAGQSPPSLYDYKGLRKDGAVVWLENRVTTINWQGKPATLIFTVDIGERKSAAASVERFVGALEFIPQGIALWDSNRRLIYSNEQYREFLGAPGKNLDPGSHQIDIIRQSVAEGNIDDAIGREDDWIEDRLRELVEPSSTRRFRHLGRWHQGTTQRLPDGAVIVQTDDIHDLITAEEQLRQAQKMEAVGQLTGGIAHDFNNLLAVTLGHLELAADGLRQDNDSLPLLEKAIAATNRGADLVHRLLAFSSKQTLSPEIVDLNLSLQHTAEMLHRVLDETIEVRIREAPVACFCKIDPGQLETALLNLAINARDAMASGGVLAITVSSANLDQADGEMAAGGYVTLTITDTGAGMSEAVLARVFEPFYTTKGQGKGTGLGLSMVYGFVKQSSGHILLESEPGVGTTFTIHLPRYDQASEAPATDAMPQSITDSNECILVVEDEPDLLAMASRLLQSLGYQVFQASDGPAAMEILASGQKIDLLLSDVVLPKGSSGPDIAARAQDLQPHIRVLFMSGYNDHPILNSNTTGPQPALIAKPFRKAQLAAQVRAILDHAN